MIPKAVDLYRKEWFSFAQYSFRFKKTSANQVLPESAKVSIASFSALMAFDLEDEPVFRIGSTAVLRRSVIFCADCDGFLASGFSGLEVADVCSTIFD